jgi:flagellar biosynthesis/type III secretory pathway protein FliH
MSLCVLHRSGEQAIAFSGGFVARGAFSSLKRADELLHQAQAYAHEKALLADEAFESQRREGYEAGYASGKSDGITAVLRTLEVDQRSRELLAVRMADVVEQCIRSVLGDIGPAEVFRRRVQHLVRTAPGTAPAVLHVSPSQAHVAQAVVAELARDSAASLNWLTVMSDDHCAPHVLVLETQVGFVDASIELTIEGVRDLIGKALLQAGAQVPLAQAPALAPARVPARASAAQYGV